MMKYILAIMMIAPITQAATLTFEEQIKEYASYGGVEKLIDQKNNKALNDYIEKQPALNPKNQTPLTRLAFGLDPKTGFKSGCLSVKAIKLVKDSVSAHSSVKVLFEWMYAILSQPVSGFNHWQLTDEVKDVYNTYPLLILSILTFIKQQCPQVQSNVIALRKRIDEETKQLKNTFTSKEFDSFFYKRLKQYGIPEAYYNLGALIAQGYVHTDLEGNAFLEEQKYEAAATCYKEAIKRGKIPRAYFNLGVLISQDHIKTDLLDKAFTTAIEKYKAAETCFREAIERGKIPRAYLNLGVLIKEDHVKIDLEGKAIITDEEKYKAAETCFRKAIERGQLSTAYYNFGVLIVQGHVKIDLEGKAIITDEEKYKAAAKYYRKAIVQNKDPDAYL
jgi:tetratricopeptide (TPR) repeat protein